MAPDASDRLADRFLALEIDAAEYDHSAHIEVGWALLRRMAFLDALLAFSNGVRALAHAAGGAQKFNLTITIVFLALIDEARRRTPGATWNEFRAANPALWDRSLLSRWYDRDRLLCPEARDSFVLPSASDSEKLQPNRTC